MVQTKFDLINHMGSFTLQNLLLTHNIAESEESLLGLGLSGSNEKEWFQLKTNVLEYNDEGWMAQVIDLDTDVRIYKRQIYTILDLLGDIGGLLDALKAFGSVFVLLYFKLTGDQISHYLLQSIFKEDINSHYERTKDSSRLNKFKALQKRRPFRL